jgi:GNAT superfamily N-acetyltransferase
MNTIAITRPIPLRLVALENAYADAFYDLVNDAEVRLFFEHFCGTKEDILARMPDKASSPNNQEYWLVAEGDTIVAYTTIKKNTTIYKALYPELELDIDDPEFLAIFDRTPEDQEAIEIAKESEKKKLAPYAVDIIVHRDHRRRGIALRTFELLAEVAKARGVK